MYEIHLIIRGSLTDTLRRGLVTRMDHMGLRHAIRAGTELCSLGTKRPSFQAFVDGIRVKGLTAALQERDAPFGNY